MSSHLRIDFNVSKPLVIILGLLPILPILGLWHADLSIWLKALGSLVCLGVAIEQMMLHGFKCLAKSIVHCHVAHNRFYIRFNDGNGAEAKLLPSSYLSQWLTILNFCVNSEPMYQPQKTRFLSAIAWLRHTIRLRYYKRQYSVIIIPGVIENPMYRALRAWLKIHYLKISR